MRRGLAAVPEPLMPAPTDGRLSSEPFALWNENFNKFLGEGGKTEPFALWNVEETAEGAEA
ncbi:MAG: hypothetical protein ACUVTH_14680, partial [Thermogutta sp.]